DRNLALIDELYARDCAFYYPAAPLGVQGSDALDELRNALAFFHGAFSDFRFEIEEQVAEGSTVVLRWTIRGTHDGKLLSPLGEIPPTGKQVCLQGFSQLRFRENMIVEHRSYFDRWGLLQQIDALPNSRAVR
ncbi:MAG: ester cyclase, partial [Chloroflexi bacterium]|nr:ester cyclase [Chloroflexota bacterium]